jgi:hypothetical protein
MSFNCFVIDYINPVKKLAGFLFVPTLCLSRAGGNPFLVINIAQNEALIL